MIPMRFNSRFTVRAGNGATFDEFNTAVSLNGGTSSPKACTFDLVLVEWRDARGHNSRTGHQVVQEARRATHTGADTPRFSRACCYLAALSSDLLAGVPRGEVMLAGLVADKRVAAHTLKGRKERQRCVWVRVWLGLRVLFRLVVVIHGSKEATRG